MYNKLGDVTNPVTDIKVKDHSSVLQQVLRTPQPGHVKVCVEGDNDVSQPPEIMVQGNEARLCGPCESQPCCVRNINIGNPIPILGMCAGSQAT